jgi:hypothetical protein
MLATASHREDTGEGKPDPLFEHYAMKRCGMENERLLGYSDVTDVSEVRTASTTRAMEAVHTRETSIYFNETTQRYDPQGLSSSYSPQREPEISLSILNLATG